MSNKKKDYPISKNVPNEITKAAIKETKQERHKNKKSYSSVKEMFNDILKEK